MKTSSKKEHILSVASDLFHKQGIRATGVDQVVAESKIAKMTLYNHFPSKDELVLAYLMKGDQDWREWFEAKLLEFSDPKDKLLAVFDVLGEWFIQPDFNGCTFIKAASEFPDRSHPFYQASQAYKIYMRDFIASLVQQLGTSRADLLASGLYLLAEGSITVQMLNTDPDAAGHAREAAAALIEACM